METFYLIDFENVHNEGLGNINSLSPNDHVHIFSTENAPNIRMDIAFSKKHDINGHIVPVRKQSLDMHLVSYLGHLLGINGKNCSYIIISKDTDYDNIISFWKQEGYPNISRKATLSANQVKNKNTNNTNEKTNNCVAYNFSGEDRSELNIYIQRGLRNSGYPANTANKICKFVIAHCNDDRMLNSIHNDLRTEYSDYSEIYENVKILLEKYIHSKSISSKKEAQIRSFFGQHFKKKIYNDHKEDIIALITIARTKQQINNELFKLYSDGNVVKAIYQTIQPLIKDLPGK